MNSGCALRFASQSRLRLGPVDPSADGVPQTKISSPMVVNQISVVRIFPDFAPRVTMSTVRSLASARRSDSSRLGSTTRPYRGCSTPMPAAAVQHGRPIARPSRGSPRTGTVRRPAAVRADQASPPPPMASPSREAAQSRRYGSPSLAGDPGLGPIGVGTCPLGSGDGLGGGRPPVPGRPPRRPANRRRRPQAPEKHRSPRRPCTDAIAAANGSASARREVRHHVHRPTARRGAGQRPRRREATPAQTQGPVAALAARRRTPASSERMPRTCARVPKTSTL